VTMPRAKRSPVPKIISDAELQQYPLVSLRVRQVSGQLVVYACFRDPRSGRSNNRRAGVTREEILISLEEIARAISTTRYGESRDSKTEFGTVAKEWFAEAAKGRRVGGRTYRHGTLDYKRDFYRAHLMSTLGPRPVGRIRLADLERLLSQLEYAEVGADAREKVRAVLRNVFRWAKERGYIVVDPSEGIRPIRKDPVDRTNDYFETDELMALQDPTLFESLRASKRVKNADYYRIHFMFLIEVGCRIGEAAAIIWPDVHISDISGHSYVVMKTSRDGRSVGPTKTQAGKRKVFITDELATELRRHREHQYDHHEANIERRRRKTGCTSEDPNPAGFVLTSPWGRPLDVPGFRRRVFRAACEEAGMDMSGETRHRPHPHTTRHSFFTHSSEAGVARSTLATAGGHKSEAATAKYIGTSDEAAIDARDRYIDRIRGGQQ